MTYETKGNSIVDNVYDNKFSSTFYENKINLTLIINYVLSISLLIWMLVPYLYRNISKGLLIFMLVFWTITRFILAFNKKQSEFVVKKTTIFVLLWIIFILLYRVLGISQAPLGNYVHLVSFWICFFIGFDLYNNGSKKSIKFILSIIWIVSVSSMIASIIILKEHPSAVTNMYRDYGTEYLNMNIGDAHFPTYCVFFFFFNLLLFKNANKYRKIIFILGMIMSIVTIIYYQKATPIIIFAIVGICWILFIPSLTHEKNNIILRLSLLVAIAFIIILLSPYFVNFLSKVFGNNEIISRLKEIVNIFYGNRFEDASVSGVSRLELDAVSIETWTGSIKNFFFGIGYSTANASGDVTTQVGQHSEFLDILARYGIVGMALILLAIYSSMKYYISNKIISKYMIIISFGCIVYFIINVFTSNPFLGIPIFILFPLALRMIKWSD